MGLLDFFRSKPQPNGGLLSVPKGSDQQAYKDYAENEMVKGNKPLPFAEWMKARQQQPAPPPK